MNYVAIVVSAIIAYIIGAFWYSPLLFGNQWMKLSGLGKKDLEKAKKQGMAWRYVVMFIAGLVMTYVTAMLVGLFGAASFGAGALVGFWIWLGFFATTLINVVLWQNKPFALYALQAAHYLVAMLVVGGVLAVW